MAEASSGVVSSIRLLLLDSGKDMKKLAFVLLLLIPLVVVSKPRLYWAARCYMNHGSYPAYWTGRKSADALDCEMHHVKTNGGEHSYWMRCRDMLQTDMPPILSQKEILAQRVMPNSEIR